MANIKEIRLINFRRFRDYSICPNPGINILIGDNEAGKSTILEAIDLVICGSVRRVEAIGLDRLLNIEAVAEFKAKEEKRFEDLPLLHVELYLNAEDFGFKINGKNNTKRVEYDGIRLVCEPNIDYRAEIESILSGDASFFPYDYYTIRFSTFADLDYRSSKKRMRSIFIDSSTMNSAYATADFVNRMYLRYMENDPKGRAEYKSEYRAMRVNFNDSILNKLNDCVTEHSYSFGLKKGPSMDFESDLMVYKDGVEIDNKGTGEQVFIKTDFALKRAVENCIILVEEPETHLSPVRLRKLVEKISDTKNVQLFITTHNSYICARLDLRNLLILQETDRDKPLVLSNLPAETQRYFIKTPPAGITEFVLSRKAILVEGPSEYMLMDSFYKKCANGKSPESDEVAIINIRGLSFKRYLDIAKETSCKVAVITDNDGNWQKNCTEKYKDYIGCDKIEIFFESDNAKNTFEVVLYKDNSKLCDKLFDSSALEYMLNNKTEAAFNLLSSEDNATADSINVPDYIKRAIEWIRE